MPSVAFSSLHDRAPFLRQTPGGGGRWGDFTFRIVPSQGLNRGVARVMGDDWLVVYDDPHDPVETDVPRSRRVIVVTEPPGVKTYHTGFLGQFGVMLAPFPVAGFEGRFVQTDVGLPWHIGLDFSNPLSPVPSRWTFEELERMEMGDKQHVLSAVVSTKTTLPRHRRRVEFVQALADRMGGSFRLFGRGFTPVDDKAEAILPFSHHLVIENNTEDSFYTEKISDSFLGWALPIFSGCKNIHSYFPKESMVCFDLDAADAIDQVIDAFNATIDAHRVASIREGRRRVMYRSNIFARLSDILSCMNDPFERSHGIVLRNRDYRSARHLIKRRVWLLGRRILPSL